MFTGFLRGVPGGKPDDFAPPSARFADPARIKANAALAWKPGKLFLGVVDGEIKRDKQGRPYVAGGHAVGVADDRHMMTIAGSRSGKGRSAIVPNMLHYAGSVLATDPKGELATMTARRRAEMGQSVFVLDPFGVASGAATGLMGRNPPARPATRVLRSARFVQRPA